MLDIDINVEEGGWAEGSALEKLSANAIAATLDHLKMSDLAGEVSILFTGDNAIAALNQQWRGLDKPTNVLSFPPVQLAVGDRPGPVVGDIVLAHETIAKEARLENIAFDAHLTHLIVHGFLHLMGYDHETDGDAELMESEERLILEVLGIDDPYSGT